jgi:hypothetical protein
MGWKLETKGNENGNETQKLETNAETLWADWKRAGNENHTIMETNGSKTPSLVSMPPP